MAASSQPLACLRKVQCEPQIRANSDCVAGCMTTAWSSKEPYCACMQSQTLFEVLQRGPKIPPYTPTVIHWLEDARTFHRTDNRFIKFSFLASHGSPVLPCSEPCASLPKEKKSSPSTL